MPGRVPPPGGPDDGDPLPPATLAEGAVGMHEIFTSMVKGGFTQWQACRILGVMLAEQGRQQ